MSKTLDGVVFWNCQSCDNHIAMVILQDDEIPNVMCMGCKKLMFTRQFIPGWTLETVEKSVWH